MPEELAKVEGVAVTRDELAVVISQTVPPQEMPGFMNAPEDVIRSESKKFSDSEIERLLMTKMASAAGYSAKREDVEADFDQWVASLPPEQKKQFEDKLQAQEGVSLDGYRETMCTDQRQQERLAVSNWLKAEVYVGLEVSDDEVKAAYEQIDPQQLTTPPQIKVAHIPFRHDGSDEQKSQAKSKAEGVVQKLQAGAEFDDMVKENPSSDGHLERMGVLDFFGPGTYNENFERAAFALGEGAISEVVETEEGFEVIKCLNIKAGDVLGLEQVGAKIKEDLFGQKATQAIKVKVEEGKTQYQVESYI